MSRAAALVLCASVTVAAAGDEWTLQLTPYVLIPSVEATLGYQAPGGSPDVGAGPTDWLELINAVVMLQAEGRRGRAFVTLDRMYLDLGNVDSTVRSVGFPDGTVPVGASANLTTDTTFDGWTVTLSGGYRVVDGEALDPSERTWMGTAQCWTKWSTRFHSIILSSGPDGGRCTDRRIACRGSSRQTQRFPACHPDNSGARRS